MIVVSLIASAIAPADNPSGMSTMTYIVLGLAAAIILWIGFRAGRIVSNIGHNKVVAAKEQELFSAQRGFKTVYEQEIAQLKQTNATLEQRVKQLEGRIEDYRKKAAGLGGLFSSSNKKTDAMYALLLENEALEEALYAQNEKLKQERTDALKEQLRATGYRRVLISQLLNDERIKDYVAEVMSDEKRLPASSPVPALPAPPRDDNR
jgi:cell division protein FtsB